MALCYSNHVETNNHKGNATMYTLMTQEYASSAQAFRTIESAAFAHAMGENGGFYKVQLIDERGVIIAEWKA